jgi:hypothetical protein
VFCLFEFYRIKKKYIIFYSVIGKLTWFPKSFHLHLNSVYNYYFFCVISRWSWFRILNLVTDIRSTQDSCAVLCKECLKIIPSEHSVSSFFVINNSSFKYNQFKKCGLIEYYAFWGYTWLSTYDLCDLKITRK